MKPLHQYPPSAWYDENGNYAGSPKVRDRIIEELERLRTEALTGEENAQCRFARMVLACWPTIRAALDAQQQALTGAPYRSSVG